jgi:hypothetical protein
MSLEIITKEVQDIKAGLASQIKTAVNEVAKETAIEQMKAVDAKIAEFKGMPNDVTGEMLTKALSDVQVLTKDFEQFQLDAKQGKMDGKKTFGEAFAEVITKNAKEIGAVRKGNGFKVEMDLKAVGNMTLGANLTGDSVVSYNNRQALLPSTKVNLRDLIPTNPSGTLVSVQYRETAAEGGIGVQTEGSAKSQIDFDFSEVKTVNKYIAGFVRYSKQMNKALPWMQSTLPRLLLREFYSGATGENATFYGTVSAAATGSTTTAETDDVKQIIDYIANQRTAKFAASFGLVSHTQLGRLNKLTYTNGYYSGSGGVLTNVDGSMAISGVPIIGTDFVADDKILILDRDYIERVEAESLMIEFFEQDSDNVQKNLITARIECLEEINLMLLNSAIFADLGNVA